jgi:ribosome maturation factor RimP
VPVTTKAGVGEAVRSALAGAGPALADVELFDLEVGRGLVRVLLDRPGGVDLDTLTAANRAISAALDAADPMPGRYMLEVSSPGLERRLRTPEQFGRYVGQEIRLKTRPGVPGERRVRGRLTAAGEAGVTMAGAGEDRFISYEDIEAARTVFEWGPAPRPGKGGRHRRERTVEARDTERRLAKDRAARP